MKNKSQENFEAVKNELYDQQKKLYDLAIREWFSNKGQIELFKIAAFYKISFSALSKEIKKQIEKRTQVNIPEDNKEIKLISSLESLDAFTNSQKYAIAHTIELYEYLANNSRETIIKNYHVQRSRDLQNLS